MGVGHHRRAVRNLNKDCASGVLPITRLLNTLHPNAVDARKMNRNASTEDQFLQNYKILEAAFRKLGIEQAAALVNNSAEQLAKGQPQSTLELMQNMYAMAGADGAERPRGLAPLDPNALGGGAAAARARQARRRRRGAEGEARGQGRRRRARAARADRGAGRGRGAARAGGAERACEVLESQLAEAREEAEFAKEEAAFYFRKLELAQELCERSATEGRSAACAPAVLRLLFMSEEEIARLDDPGQLLAPAMEA